MKSTLINFDIQRALKLLIDTYPIVRDIVNDIEKNNGKAYLVGGAVRDVILGRNVKDLDIEIHRLSVEHLERILKRFGVVSLVGKIFGVFRVHGIDVDWSLPRSDKPGRKPDVNIEPGMTIEKALRRRDLTMNAMAIDIIEGMLIDPFDGCQDIKNRTLRTPDPAFFIEDPLRFYRVMQFISRFEMFPDEELNMLCKEMDVYSVSVERIEQEFRKMMLKSCTPSLGIRWINFLGRLGELFPELAKLVDLPQRKKWHPESDVFEHTMQTVDAAAHLHYDSEEEKLIVLLSALCHDLGKATTTKKVKGEWRSYGHSKAGEEISKKLLKRITKNKDLISAVVKMVRYHMAPIQFVEDGAKYAAYKRLANKLAPQVTLEMLAKLSLADLRGRNGESHKPLDKDSQEIRAFLENAQKARVLNQIEKSVLQGRDLVDVVSPGPKMGELLKRAYEIQIEEGIDDKDELKRRVLLEK